MNDIYDLLVIGGGPAGATLARLAGEGGLRVLVIDGALPGRPKLCGGLISPDARKTLKKMDLVLRKSCSARRSCARFGPSIW